MRNKQLFSKVLSVLLSGAILTGTASAESISLPDGGIIDDTDGIFYPCEAVGDVSEEWDGTVATEYAGGTGTQTDPYLISNGQELAYLAQQTDDNIDLTGVYFKLTADILLNADVDDDPIAWDSIGESELVDDVPAYFDGTFDGDGHKVIGMYQNGSDEHGLFAKISTTGTVKNVGVTDGRIVASAGLAGGIAGANYGTISNCYNAIRITSSSNEDYYGGICGYNSGTIENCFNTGELYLTGGISSNSLYYVAGICGYSADGSISDCYNTARIYTTSDYVYDVAGVCGYKSKGTISGCHNTGAVTGKNTTGGICAQNAGDISDCYNTGTITGTYSIGGICGDHSSGDITDCYNTGIINGTSVIGGICGNLKAGDIKDCYNAGAITGSGNYVGGICGNSTNTTNTDVILRCYNTGNVDNKYSNINYRDSYGKTGGICGSFTGYLIKQCYNTGTISSACSYTAGICGELVKGEVRECYNSGDVSASTKSTKDSGGIAGYIQSDSVIENCYNTAQIYGYSNAGGLWGYSSSSTTNTMANCYNIGKVLSSNTSVSGYSVGNDNGQISNVYFDSNICTGSYTPVAAWARTTEQLTAETAIADLGFDTAKWSKKPNSTAFLHYPDLTNIADDNPVYFAGAPVPTGLKAAAGYESVTLTWDEMEDAESYSVYIYADENVTELASDLTTTTYTATGLTNGVEVGFTVKSCINSTLSEECDIVYATPCIPAPTGLNAVAGNGTVTLTWDAFTGAECYAVNMYIGDECTALTSDLTATTYTATGLTNGEKVGFTVKLCINGEWSDECEKVFATPKAPAPAPNNLKAVAGDGKVTLTWNAVEDATKYAVYKYENSTYTCVSSSVTGTSFNVTGLTNGTKYGFKVKAYVDGKWTAASAMVYATPVGNIIPENLRIANGNGKVQITWDKVSGATKYTVYSYLNGKYTTETSSATINTYTVTGLTNGTKYGFKVKAYVNGKWSAASAIIYARPSASTAPGAIKATAGNKSAAVKWSGVIGATKYAVYKYENGVYTCVNSNITDTSFTVTGLTNGKQYGFKVKAYVDGKWSAASVISYATPTA